MKNKVIAGSWHKASAVALLCAVMCLLLGSCGKVSPAAIKKAAGVAADVGVEVYKNKDKFSDDKPSYKPTPQVEEGPDLSPADEPSYSEPATSNEPVQALQAYSCPTCGGDGATDGMGSCQVCGGIGIDYNGFGCGYCSGTGSVYYSNAFICGSCNGSGVVYL